MTPSTLDVTRRNFLKVSAIAGGGMLLSAYVPFGLSKEEEAILADFTPNAFIRVTADGKITINATSSLAPRGYYRLFAINADGAISMARWTHLT